MTPRLFLTALLLTGTADLNAQDRAAGLPDSTHGLKEVVVTGVSAPVRRQDALSLYRVIDAQQIRAQGAVTLAEALNAQLNLTIGSDAVLGSSVQLQGLRPDKVKILIDGLPVNGRVNGAIDLGQLNLAAVERIEIVQGPMSVVYGSDALGGVINLITKTTRKPEFTVRGFTETVGRYNVDATAAYRFNARHAATLTAGRNFFEGWGYLDTVAPLRQRIFKPKTQYFANGAYDYNAPSGFHLKAASDFLQEKLTSRGAAYVDPYRAYGLDQRFYVTRSINRLLLEGKAGRTGRWNLANSYSLYHRIRQSVSKDLVSLQETPTAGTGDQDTTRFDDVTLRSNYSNRWGRLHLDGGYDVSLQRGHSGKLDTAASRYSQNDYALYANAAVDFWSQRATLQAGLRAAHNDRYNAPLVPSFNLLLKPSGAVQVRASYAQGFRAPTLKELYLQFIDQNHEIIGNPALKAERSQNLQLSVSAQRPVMTGWTLNAIASGFYNDIRDGITLVNPTTDPNSLRRIYGNLTHQRNAIGNLQLEATGKTLRLTAGYGLTHTFAEPGAYEAFDVQEVTATAAWTWKGPALTVSAFYKYTGSGRLLVADADGTATYGGSTVGFHMLDASVERAFWNRRVLLLAGVKNLLDVRNLNGAAGGGGVHGSAGTGPLLPRRAFAQLSWTFH